MFGSSCTPAAKRWVCFCGFAYLLCCMRAARNDRLVIDLGGVHNPMEKTFDLDSLNLTEARSLTSVEVSQSASTCPDVLELRPGFCGLLELLLRRETVLWLRVSRGDQHCAGEGLLHDLG